MKYEYQIYQAHPIDMKLINWLNRMGQEGWQLVYHNGDFRFIFMRAVRDVLK